MLDPYRDGEVGPRLCSVRRMIFVSLSCESVHSTSGYSLRLVFRPTGDRAHVPLVSEKTLCTNGFASIGPNGRS